MQVHPALKRLRRDPAHQTSDYSVIRQAHKDWLSHYRIVPIVREFTRYARGEQFATLPTLSRIFGSGGCASGSVDEAGKTLVEELNNHFISALRKRPLADLPLRHSASEGVVRLQLLRIGNAALSLCVYEPVVEPALPEVVRFADRESHEIVLAGVAKGIIAERRADLHVSEQIWKAGDRIECLPCIRARQVVSVDQSLLVLQLTRQPENPLPSCDYRVTGGALVRQINGDRKASEQLMALSVIGALGHREGLGTICEFADNIANERDARWEAVRQALAMDARRGVHVLSAISRRNEDSLQRPAEDLRKRLMASHPELAREPEGAQ